MSDSSARLTKLPRAFALISSCLIIPPMEGAVPRQVRRVPGKCQARHAPARSPQKSAMSCTVSMNSNSSI